MGREIRRVPANWEHPRKAYGQEHDYEQLSDDYIGYLKYWEEDVNQFIKHMTEVIKTGKTVIYNKEYTDPQKVYDYLNDEEQALNPSNISGYMPSGSWYQLYQNVGEGSPLSPPFKTKDQLVKWLSNNKDYWGHTWTPEQAAAMVKSEYAPSGMYVNGKMYTAEESTLL